MQQAEGLFQFDFSLPLYEDLIVCLVNVCHFLRSTFNYALYRSYSLSVSIKTLYAVVFALYARSFGHRKIVLQEILVILAKFAPQGLEIAKFWARNRVEILLEFTALMQ